MALTRKFLSAMGIEQDKIEEIIQAHVETINALKDERNEALEKVKSFDEISTKYNDLVSKDFENKFINTQKELEEIKDNIQKEKTSIAKQKAYTKLLKEENIADKYIDSILKVTDFNNIALDENNNLNDIESLRSNVTENFQDFIESKKITGAKVAHPVTTGNPTATTKEEIMKIKDGEARRKAIAENPELFNL